MDLHSVSDSITNNSNLGTYKMAKEQQACEFRMAWFIGYYHCSMGIAFILYWTKLFILLRMRKYLREIELAGVILAIIGVISSLIWGSLYGGWLCGIGILLMLIVFLYKAFHWNEYARENKQYIWIILLTIAILFIQMLRAR